MPAYKNTSEQEQHNQAPIGRRLLLWTGYSLAGMGALIMVLALVGITFQAVATASDNRNYPPPGQLVDVGGFQLHIYCEGEGDPVIIIDAGTGGWSNDYRHLLAEISQDARVCVFDRAGYGWSDPGPLPRTSQTMAKELHTLLTNANIAPPFILVGHSMGGYNVRVFADLYPEEVAGIVLVESANEDQWSLLPPEVGAFLSSQIKSMRRAAIMSRLGLLRLVGTPVNPHLSPQLQQISKTAWARSQTFDVLIAEMESVHESAAQVRATGSLGDIPLVVISASNSFEAFRTPDSNFPFDEANHIWMVLQSDLAQLSTSSTHLISDTGTHHIHTAEPEMIVAAIRQMIRAVDR